jgi:hypothetical protein
MGRAKALRESVKVGDAPLDPARTYSLATNDFMARGGDDYVMFLDIKPRLPLATSNPHDGIRQQDRSCVVLMCRSSAARDVTVWIHRAKSRLIHRLDGYGKLISAGGSGYADDREYQA